METDIARDRRMVLRSAYSNRQRRLDERDEGEPFQTSLDDFYAFLPETYLHGYHGEGLPKNRHVYVPWEVREMIESLKYYNRL